MGFIPLLLFTSTGLALLYVSFVEYRKTKGVLDGGIKTSATINSKELIKRPNARGGSYLCYECELTYVDCRGKTIKQVRDFNKKTTLSVGDTIEIVYDRKKTEIYRTLDHNEGFAIFVILGIGFAALGIFLFILAFE